MIKGEKIALSYLIFGEAAIAVAIVPPLMSSSATNTTTNSIVLPAIVAFAPY